MTWHTNHAWMCLQTPLCHQREIQGVGGDEISRTLYSFDQRYWCIIILTHSFIIWNRIRIFTVEFSLWIHLILKSTLIWLFSCVYQVQQNAGSLLCLLLFTHSQQNFSSYFFSQEKKVYMYICAINDKTYICFVNVT